MNCDKKKKSSFNYDLRIQSKSILLMILWLLFRKKLN